MLFLNRLGSHNGKPLVNINVRLLLQQAEQQWNELISQYIQARSYYTHIDLSFLWVMANDHLVPCFTFWIGRSPFVTAVSFLNLNSSIICDLAVNADVDLS